MIDSESLHVVVYMYMMEERLDMSMLYITLAQNDVPVPLGYSL